MEEYYPTDHGPITVPSVIRIGRKIVKLLFAAFRRPEDHGRNLDATLTAYRDMIVRRTPRVQYRARPYRKKYKPGVDYFQKLIRRRLRELRLLPWPSLPS